MLRIEISAGGFGPPVMDFQSDLACYISDAESMISGFKAVQNSTYSLNGGVGSLQEPLDSIAYRIQTEEDRRADAQAVLSRSDSFIQLAGQIDRQVADSVNRSKEELYCVNPWLRPPVSTEEEVPWYEAAWDWLTGAGETIVEGVKSAWEWTKDTAVKAWNGIVDFYEEHKKVIDTVLIVVGAVAAIAAVVFSGGTAGAALVPLLTTLGVSASTASTVSAVVAGTAVVSTLAAGALNVYDVWEEVDDPTFNAWQTGLNITSVVSNAVYSVGGIYNSVKGYKLFSRVDWNGYPEGAPKPEGFYRLLPDDEYAAARSVANKTNARLHRLDPSLEGLQIHEVHPVKFGGSPDGLSNKLYLTPEEHAKFTTFWNNLMKKGH